MTILCCSIQYKLDVKNTWSLVTGCKTVSLASIQRVTVITGNLFEIEFLVACMSLFV